ncbi:nuclear transport factor 2 family protein [Dactylosporangium matsuzakiense]|uniref:Polyketide cyclase n=1 Tax=Dactylosporangium matsuzakiense TaxID=53360 RepID=A0A9W6KBU7_9ACTN|nr:nuclear transport factor 2 family protein [Dactylosporangium matsuzakiense]GLK99250.1 polyketide cyclase [Dactylosporangium matsuzakiense]
MSSDVTLVRELADRTAITAVLHTYARLVDERAFAAVAGVFTDDCLAEYGIGEDDTLRSAAAVVDWLTRRLPAGTTTSHHISNVLIAFPDADHAETTAYVHAWHGVPGAPVDPVLLARYADSFVRTPAGWRIAHRRMFAHGLIGFPDGILRPLPRHGEAAAAHA